MWRLIFHPFELEVYKLKMKVTVIIIRLIKQANP